MSVPGQSRRSDSAPMTSGLLNRQVSGLLAFENAPGRKLDGKCRQNTAHDAVAGRTLKAAMQPGAK